jgi:hypothetical protein
MRTAILILSVALAGCMGPRSLSARADSRQMGGGESVAKIEVPEGWYNTASKSDRAEAAAPDNFTRVSLVTTPVLADEKGCPDFATRAAQDAVNGLKGQKPDLVADGAKVSFAADAPASPPGPNDRRIIGQALCRNGVVAVVACSSGVKRADMGNACKKIVDSLSVETTSMPVGVRISTPPAAAPVIVPEPGTKPDAQPQPGSPGGGNP